MPKLSPVFGFSAKAKPSASRFAKSGVAGFRNGRTEA